MEKIISVCLDVFSVIFGLFVIIVLFVLIKELLLFLFAIL